MKEFSQEEVQGYLKKLEKGESVTVKVDGEEITYTNVPEPVKPCEQHYFEFAGAEGEHYAAAKCKNCINGRVYDTRTHHLVEGVITSLG